jgi:hypothetical protein
MNSNLNYNNLPIDTEGTETDQISKYTIKQSKDRLDKLSNLLNQHLGKNWKVILFLISIFIIFMAILIRYGLNMYSTHNNLFLSIFIVSIFIFTIWIVILPEKDTRIFGIVPFPKDSPYIPADSSQCGLSPTICSGNDCSTKCGSDNYICTNIGEKDIFYLGTQLDKNKSFCLPKQGLEKINDCGTYTGRAVWSSDKSWICKCTYPELYSGDTCTDKVDENSNFCLQNKDGSPSSICWNNSTMPKELINKTPYDRDMVMVCGDGYNFYGGSCQQDICLNGEGSSSSAKSSAKFNNKTKKCDCLPPTFQSNISGFCFADVTGNCNPHPKTNKCMYDIDIGGVTKYALFKLNGIPCLSFSITDPKPDSQPYPILVDMTTSNLLNNPTLIDMSIVLKDAFYAFPIIKFENLTQDQQKNISSIIKSAITGNDELSALFSKKIATQNDTPFGVAKLCNSFYYKNFDSNDEKYNCNNMLSITGTDYKRFMTGNLENDCGKGSAGCDFDLSSSNGRKCRCGNGQTVGSDGRCKNCLPSGTELHGDDINNPSLCCSGKITSSCGSSSKEGCSYYNYNCS